VRKEVAGSALAEGARRRRTRNKGHDWCVVAFVICF
jgi:allantoicase